MRLPDEIIRARLMSAKHFPYFAAALWRVTFHEAHIPVGPMAIDKFWRVYYDPSWLKKLTPLQMAFCLTHEINHGIRAHCKRVGERDPMLWNIASDMEINDDLPTDNICTQEFSPVFPASFGLPKGLSAEKYYELLKKQAKHIKIKVNCGSGAHGHSEDHEKKDGDQQDGKGTGDKPDDGQVGEEEQDLIRHAVAQAAKAAGDLPKGMQRWVDETLNPTVPWQTLLSRYMRASSQIAAGCLDYTYSRPSRRRWPGVVLPRMIGRKATAAIVFDTSGSMSKDLLSQALAETRGIAKAGNMNSVVYFVDAQVASTAKAGDYDLANRLKGGGGTDMCVGIRAALEGAPKPDVIVVLTDGETPWPKTAPEVPVIVCLVESGYKPQPPPKWAHVVEVNAA